MLNKGKRGGYYLYELTDTDLVWGEQFEGRYQAGNVLLFGNKKDIALGLELMKADDLSTALAYLDVGSAHGDVSQTANQESLSLLKEQLAETRESISGRDDLLRDLVGDLESQRYSNKMLIAQLESLREQICIEQLSRNEVIGDLQIVSEETLRKDQELQKAIDANTELQQELAARICELIELDSANRELQKRLEQHRHEEAASSSLSPSSHPMTFATENPLADEHKADISLVTKTDAGQVYTMSTGKQIHVYHEFPASKRSAKRFRASALRGMTRILCVVLMGAFLFLFGSVVATAQLNGLSVGEALDATLKTLAFW